MIYDAIIVGSGIGALSAGLTLVKNHKKVLILEKNSIPGGLISTFKKGSFEFNTSLYHLYNYGVSSHVGELQKEIKNFGIELDTQEMPINIRLKAIENNLDISFVGSFEEWLVEIEKLVPNSLEPLRNYLKIVKEIHEALEIIKKGEVPSQDDYKNFYRFLKMNTIEAFSTLKVPKSAVHLLAYNWPYLGSPLHKLSFIDFSDFMYQLIFKKDVILKESNLSFILKLVEKFEEMGGVIYTRSNVTDISLSLDKNKVRLATNEEYYAKEIICDVSSHKVFKDLIKEPYPFYNKMENARTISYNSLIVYLGLNKSAQDLGLTNYHYYEYQNINSEKNFKNYYMLNHRNIEAIVPNIANPYASLDNTCILILKTNYYGNPFKSLQDHYEQVRESLVTNLIAEFEHAFNIDIVEYIKEIKIMMPDEICEYSANPSINGYMRLGYDNMINRVLEDSNIKGLSFVGGFSTLASGCSNVFMNGISVANNILERKDNNE